ncbi:MAG: hypothetical protein ACOYOQ_00605 [Microthrixaceae bacterium]
MTAAKHPPVLDVYRGEDGRWWWRVKARNHRVIGAAEQGHLFRWYARRKALAQFPTAVEA